MESITLEKTMSNWDDSRGYFTTLCQLFFECNVKILFLIAWETHIGNTYMQRKFKNHISLKIFNIDIIVK